MKSKLALTMLSLSVGLGACIDSKLKTKPIENNFYPVHVAPTNPVLAGATDLKGLVLAQEPNVRAVSSNGWAKNYGIAIAKTDKGERFFVLTGLKGSRELEYDAKRKRTVIPKLSRGNLDKFHFSDAVELSETSAASLVAFLQSLDNSSSKNPRLGKFQSFSNKDDFSITCSRMPSLWECGMTLSGPLKKQVYFFTEEEQRTNLINLIKLGMKQTFEDK